MAKKKSEKDLIIFGIVRFLNDCPVEHLRNMAGIIGLFSNACLKLRDIYQETGIPYGIDVNLIKPFEGGIRPENKN